RQETDPLHEFHRQEPLLAIRQQFVEADQVGVSDVRQRAKLLLEAVQFRRVYAPQRLYGDRLAGLAVIRAVDDAHAAAAQLAQDVVPGDRRLTALLAPLAPAPSGPGPRRGLPPPPAHEVPAR